MSSYEVAASVDFLTVMRDLGLEAPSRSDFTRPHMQIVCPFRHRHYNDDSNGRTFRIYLASNSGWCFKEALYFDSVTLWAEMRGLSRNAAVEELLSRYDPPRVKVKPRDRPVSLADLQAVLDAEPLDSSNYAVLQQSLSLVRSRGDVQFWFAKVKQARSALVLASTAVD